MGNFPLPQDVLDLTEIPAFMRRGTPEYAEAGQQAAEAKAVLVKENGRRPKDLRDQKPTAAQVRSLEKLGWTRNQIRRLNRLEAGFSAERRFGPEVRFPGGTPKADDT